MISQPGNRIHAVSMSSGRSHDCCIERFSNQGNVESVVWDSYAKELLIITRTGSGNQIMTVDNDGQATCLPINLEPRSNLNYGGGALAVGPYDYFIVSGSELFAVNKADYSNRLLFSGGAFASPTLSPGGSCLAIVFRDSDDKDYILGIDQNQVHEPTVLVKGSDFYMQPAWSPNGKYLAWIEWDAPHMPWDDARLGFGKYCSEDWHHPVSECTRICEGSAVLQPTFGTNDLLYFLSDASGPMRVACWNKNASIQTWCTSEKYNLFEPAWRSDTKRFAFAGDSIVSLSNEGDHDLLVSTHFGRVAESKEHPSTIVSAHDIVQVSRNEVVFVGSTQGSVRELFISKRCKSPTCNLKRRDSKLSSHVSWKGGDGTLVNGLLYEPSPGAIQSPSLAVFAHGGPTMQFRRDPNATFDMLLKLGWYVLAVNYRGSSGYGRPYLEQLYGQWGRLDVDDCVSGAKFVRGRHLVDEARVAIFGESAGGLTALNALIHFPEVFNAGVCSFPVSDLVSIRNDIPKFERGYVERLVGSLELETLKSRSPIYSIAQLRRPLCLFHGQLDEVIPVSHSIRLAGAINSRGIQCQFQTLNGEGHGWSKNTTVQYCNDAIADFLSAHF